MKNNLNGNNPLSSLKLISLSASANGFVSVCSHTV